MARAKRTKEGGFLTRDLIKNAVQGVKDVAAKATNTLNRALVRHDYPPSVRKWLKDNGHRQIESITIVRAPVASAIDGALNAISLGKWASLKQKYGYDKFFHLGMHCQFRDDKGTMKTVQIEKLEAITVSQKLTTKEDAEYHSVPVRRKVSFQEMFDEAHKAMGDRLFLYDPLHNNCQDFLINLLRQSSLLDGATESFIKQPIDSIVKELPQYVGVVGRLATDIGATVNHLVQGHGLDAVPKSFPEAARKRIAKAAHIPLAEATDARLHWEIGRWLRGGVISAKVKYALVELGYFRPEELELRVRRHSGDELESESDDEKYRGRGLSAVKLGQHGHGVLKPKYKKRQVLKGGELDDLIARIADEVL